MELLGSDAGSEDESQEDEESHIAAVEKKWASKLMDRVEKSSATKFLEFCGELRTVVSTIWVGAPKLINH